MKTSLDILKSWFQTGDKPTENQFKNLIDSFYHKDDGTIITDYEVSNNGNVSFKLSDGTVTKIERFVLPNTMPLNFINGLVETLNNKVNKETGKQLSDENFSLELKQKLTSLKNYVHPEFHQITEIEGLQTALETKIDVIDGKQLSDENFSAEEKKKLATLENYVASDSKPISYIEELEDTLNTINQQITEKVDIVDGKQLSDENFSIEEKEKLASFDIATFSSISDGENTINAKGQADQLTFEGVTVDPLTNTIKIESESSGLEKITEDDKSGWRLKGEIADNHGPIGENAIDLSIQDQVSDDRGATGLYSFATGVRTTASEAYSFSGGFGSSSKSNGSFSYGFFSTAYSPGEFVIGMNGTEYTPKDNVNFNKEDRIFNVGIGASTAFKADALTVLKNGEITAPSTTIQDIKNAGDKSLVTKEYVDLKFKNQTTSTITADETINNTVINVSSNVTVSFKEGTYSFGMSPRNFKGITYAIPKDWTTKPVDYSEIIFKDHLVVVREKTITFY